MLGQMANAYETPVWYVSAMKSVSTAAGAKISEIQICIDNYQYWNQTTDKIDKIFLSHMPCNMLYVLRFTYLNKIVVHTIRSYFTR